MFISILPASHHHESSILPRVSFALFEILLIMSSFFLFFFLPWFFVLRLKRASVTLLIKLIFFSFFFLGFYCVGHQRKIGSLFIFLGAFELSCNEYGFSIWTFKHQFWFSVLVFNYHWILSLFFFFDFCWSNCI